MFHFCKYNGIYYPYSYYKILDYTKHLFIPINRHNLDKANNLDILLDAKEAVNKIREYLKKFDNTYVSFIIEKKIIFFLKTMLN